MNKRIGTVYNSFIADIDLNAQSTFMFLCGCNTMSHIGESAVLMENSVTQPKWVDIQGVHKVLIQFKNFVMKSVLNIS